VKKSLAALATIAATIAAISPIVHANEAGLHGDVGTTGVGFHATMPLRDNMNVRLGLGYLGYSYNGSTRDMDYRLKLTANTYDALLDWFPSKDSSFRITTGLAYNGNKIEARGEPDANGNFTIGGNTYSAASAGAVKGKVSFNKIAPYLGIGWGRGGEREKGWSFSTDIGVLFQGSAKTSLSSSGCSAGTAACAQLNADLARENRDLRKEADRFKLYPVVRVGVSYKF
jgi:opacity protein-like surface antigen